MGKWGKMVNIFLQKMFFIHLDIAVSHVCSALPASHTWASAKCFKNKYNAHSFILDRTSFTHACRGKVWKKTYSPHKAEHSPSNFQKPHKDNTKELLPAALSFLSVANFQKACTTFHVFIFENFAKLTWHHQNVIITSNCLWCKVFVSVEM